MSSQTPPLFKSPYGPPGTPADPRHLIHYATDGVQPPSAVYTTVDDLLSVNYATIDTPFTLGLTYRVLLPNGEIQLGQEQFASLNSIGTNQRFGVSLPEGFLLSVEAGGTNVGGIASRGLTRVRVFLQRAPLGQQLFTEMLCEGMVDNVTHLTWPGGTHEPGCSGQGSTRPITGTTPAAGAEISESVPAGRRWDMKSFRFQFTTSAAVATRGVAFLIDDGANTLFVIEAPSTQAASLVQQYVFAPIGARADKVFSVNVTTPIPPHLLAAGGYRFRTLTSNLQAGDQYSAPNYNTEEWFTNP